MIVYAIIPARSGSKGVPNKNIRLCDGKHLLSYSIEFAKYLGCNKIICSTDSLQYKNIAEHYGAEVPFLRSDKAASDNAMEEDILEDLQNKFLHFNMPLPDIIVWLRPTFVFRDREAVIRGISLLASNSAYSAVRIVTEGERRLYTLNDNILNPIFDDKNRSMIRRQDVGTAYKVFNTDIFRFNHDSISEDFMGRNIFGIVVDKICGFDIDDESDFVLVESMLRSNNPFIRKYTYGSK